MSILGPRLQVGEIASSELVRTTEPADVSLILAY